MPPVAATRRALAGLLAAAEGEDRYVDLCLVVRRLTADFLREVPEGYLFEAGGIWWVTAGPGQVGVPVRSSVIGESARVPDQTPIEGGGVVHAEELLRAGGRWDTVAKRYVEDPPERPLVFDVMESQVEVTRWFSAWLIRYVGRQRAGTGGRRVRDIRTLLNYGNRGGGKTVLCLVLTVALCLAVPGTIAWVISVSRTQSTEDVHENLLALLPKAWAKYRGQPLYRFKFLNGSRLREMTADEPADLKQGRVDLAFINEGAKMPKLGYAYPIGRISDRGGICLIASNPPTPDVPKGIWVLDLHEKWEEAQREGRYFPMVVFRVESEKNAAIDQGAREDVAILLAAVSPQLARADAEGRMAAIGERLIYAYDKVKHARPCPPEGGDITYEFTRKKYGRGFPYVAGCDFQDSPYIIASFWRIYGSMDRPLLWCVSDFVCKGSEDDFLDEVLLGGVPLGEGESEEIEPGTVLWIGDSSAQWQDRKHRGEQALLLPPSFAFWKHRGLVIIPPATKLTPEAKYAKNPPWSISVGQVNRWLGTDRMWVSPVAKYISTAFKECQAKEKEGGGQRAEAQYAHAIDTARYVAWWVEPPVRKKAPPGRGPGVSVLPGR